MQVDVNGPHTDPIYSFLKLNLPKDNQGDAAELRWNFQKFLVDKTGYPQRFFHEDFDKESIRIAIKVLLEGNQDLS